MTKKFVDWITAYEVPYIPDSSIPIYGIGLDNLTEVMDEPMQIIESIGIIKR